MRLKMLLNFNFAYKFAKKSFSSVANNQTRECFVRDFENGLSKIILNRPQKMNSIGKQMLSDLGECIEHVSDKRIVIIESACEKAFSTGADLKERLAMNGEETVVFVDKIREIFNNLSKLKIPTIACIDGLALGGGLELALACDIKVASFRSKLGFPETKLSIFPAAGGTQRLTWLIGPAKAKELIFAAEIIDADYAKILGILNHVQETPLDLCEAIADKILRNGPLGVSAAKKAIDAEQNILIEHGLNMEKAYYLDLINTDDRLEGLKAFSEKRKPNYKGK